MKALTTLHAPRALERQGRDYATFFLVVSLFRLDRFNLRLRHAAQLVSTTTAHCHSRAYTKGIH
jgi:hypothetical protein